MGQSFYRGSEMCILVFDITSPETFTSIESWRSEFLEQLNPSNPNEFPFVLIGNKCDRENEMQVNKEQIENFCKEHNNMPFYMCSAKNNIGLEEAFKKVVDMALENNKKGEENFVPKALKLTVNPEKKKKKCC